MEIQDYNKILNTLHSTLSCELCNINNKKIKYIYIDNICEIHLNYHIICKRCYIKYKVMKMYGITCHICEYKKYKINLFLFTTNIDFYINQYNNYIKCFNCKLIINNFKHYSTECPFQLNNYHLYCYRCYSGNRFCRSIDNEEHYNCDLGEKKIVIDDNKKIIIEKIFKNGFNINEKRYEIIEDRKIMIEKKDILCYPEPTFEEINNYFMW